MFSRVTEKDNNAKVRDQTVSDINRKINLIKRICELVSLLTCYNYGVSFSAYRNDIIKGTFSEKHFESSFNLSAAKIMRYTCREQLT